MKSKTQNPIKKKNKAARKTNPYTHEVNIKRMKSMLKTKKKKYFEKLKSYENKSAYVRNLIKNESLVKNETTGLALVSSFILTDGWITRRKGLEIGFSNKNQELVNAFNDIIYVFFRHTPSSIIKIDGQIQTRFVASWHNDFINRIKEFCYEDGKKTAKNILELDDKEVLNECVRIALSCDGYISWYIESLKYMYDPHFYYNRIRPELGLGCKSEELRKEWYEIAENIGLKFRIKKDRLLASSWPTLSRYLKIGGFLNGVLIGDDSKVFTGKEKNQVLSKLLEYKTAKPTNIKDRLNIKHKLKKEVIDFIKK